MARERFVIRDGDEPACAVSANDRVRAPEDGGSFGDFAHAASNSTTSMSGG